MAVNGTISIYRVTATPATDTETEVTDKVEFNGTQTTPDAKSFITRLKPTMTIIGQENPNPDSNNPNSIDETGLAFVGLELWGYFDGTSGTRPIGITSFRNWMKEDKRNTTFPFGRFGFRNNISDEWNVVPTTTYGYLLEHFETDEEYGKSNGKIEFYCKLRYQGAITGLNA